MSLTKLFAWGPYFVGSTRAVALVRIGLALVIWARFARAMALHSHTEPWQMFVTVIFFVSTTLMLVGLYTRFAVAMTATTLAILYFYFGYGGIRAEWAAHHIYLMMSATALLAMTPCGRSYSIDRYRAVRRAESLDQPLPPESGPLWGQRLIVLQMSALYFWTAVDKTNIPFLSGERLEAILMWGHSGRPLEALLLSPAFFVLASILVVVVEYFLAVGILARRLLPVAVPVGIGLHAAFFLALPLATYSILMILLYLMVLDPDAVHRTLDRIQGHGAPTHHL